ncbi:alpha/beta fold hydrolase [Streptomyces sp. NBC_00582]|uniref:alpha/beta fold hydrolase n=1 Tax=Streptomyces sp. NBC_00582 TaxID=2975783 RepID=UPI0010E14978|nr:alpha/beta hydrolase [Streptomyces sp. NBC_00582]WUB66996.1 alpha/beta hydrolase [Streptomyces sp. NBC_00582]
MPRLMVGRENGTELSLYYEDFGTGDPVVLVPGWPFTQVFWEAQVHALTAAGHRVVTYDRRGFGRSTRAWTGYDYDTLAGDLHRLVEHLGLATMSLVGFSSGCGEVTRYAAAHGADRVHRLVLAGPILVGAGDELVADLLAASRRHRIPMLDDVLTRFFSVDGACVLDEPTRLHHLQLAASASPKGTADSVEAWPTANRQPELARIDVPTLIIHGERDAFMPYQVSGAPVARAVPDSRTTIVPGAPHGVPLTHPDQWNKAVLAFLAA